MRGHKVIVASLRAIYESENKNERDAEMIGRFDRKLNRAQERAASTCTQSHPHPRCFGGFQVKLVNHVRGSLKSLGIFLPSGCSTEAFARKATAALTQEDYALVAPALEMIAALSERIKAEDKRIDAMIEEDYPAAQKLMTIPGVGPITALAFVLIIGSPDRFDRARCIFPRTRARQRPIRRYR